ncbi:MAG: class I SAM-dependent rRNA methyltransferase [Myxococcaceae bacterium]|nr:class I SAM-dependent rRNA methyltransferase [Myxococcaceae bacterium]
MGVGAGLTDALRLFDAETHTVDVFGDVAILSTYGDDVALEPLLAKISQPTVYLKRRPREARTSVADDVAPPVPVRGAPVESLVAHEAGLKFEIRPPNGLSVGLYVDSAVPRAWVREHARGKTVLNLFSYTCGFGVAALAGGASRVLNVDRSRKVLDWGERNYALNGLAVERRDFLAGDAFEWVGRLAKKGEQFDVVVLDPPSFATSDRSRFSAAKDYAGLVRSVSPLVGETLLACCNLAAADSRTVRGWVAQSMTVVDELGVPAPLKVFVARPR